MRPKKIVILAGLLASVSSAAIGQEGKPDSQTFSRSADAKAPVTGSDQITAILVEGTERLEPQTILSYAQLKVGDPYDQVAADQVIKDLYRTELLSSVTVRFDEGILVIEVVESPVVNRILLEGNKRLKSDKITPEIKLAPRQIYTRSKVRADTQRIIELYKRQGRFSATVEPKMLELGQNRVDIVYEISEGPKSKIRQINIIGNSVFTDGELFDQMVTKQSRLTNILSSNTSYDPDRLAFDQQKLRQFYLTQGYADFRVVSAVAELTPDKSNFIITYVVEEGERYKFGHISVESEIRAIDDLKLAENISIREGNWYDAKAVEDTVEQLSELAQAFGYAFADAHPEFRSNKDDLTMGISFVLKEAPRVYVESIDVNGNTLTKDTVVRREFRLAEGDAFNSLSIKRSANRIKSLGYFQESFDIEQVASDGPDRVVLKANVEEQPTGDLQLSAGFSSIENFVLGASIRQRNFRGMGQTIGAGINWSSYSRSANLSFTDPYLFDQNISLGLDLYRKDYSNSGFNSDDVATYAQTTNGLSARVGVPLSEYLSLIGSYTLNFENVTLDEDTYFADFDGDGNVDCEPLLAGRYLCDALGHYTSSIAGATLAYSSLDNGFRPTRGVKWSLSGELAGLGGDSRFIRLRGDAKRYWNVGNGFIFSAQVEGGYVHNVGDDETRLTDRFYLGESSFKGFDLRGVGPAVKRTYLVTDDDGAVTDGTVTREAIGGNAYYKGRAELEIPVSAGMRELGLRPSLFLEVGSVFSISSPVLSSSPYPDGTFVATTNSDGNPLYWQVFDSDNDGALETEYVTSAYAPDGSANSPLGTSISPFYETFVGDTWKPRVSVGIGVNWNSPFGPFRLDLSHVIAKQNSDETKTFSFNVGTQF